MNLKSNYVLDIYNDKVEILYLILTFVDSFAEDILSFIKRGPKI